jgi:hypothetical protein
VCVWPLLCDTHDGTFVGSTHKKRLTELEEFIQDSSSDWYHEEDYHEAKLLLYYLTNSHRLSTRALKAWGSIRRCGSIGSGDVRVAPMADRCGSVKPMLCVFAKRRYIRGDLVTTYNGRLVFFQSTEERNTAKKLKSHQRVIPGCGRGLDGLPFSEIMGQSDSDFSGACDSDRPSAMSRLLTATGVGYMCNAPSMNCRQTQANVAPDVIKTYVQVPCVLYSQLVVLVATRTIEEGDKIIYKYHESGDLNSTFHFDCMNPSHFQLLINWSPLQLQIE